MSWGKTTTLGGALLLSALVVLLPSQLSEAGIGLGGVTGGNIASGGGPPPPPPTFVFSYPPPAILTPINPGEQSISLTNSFGTFTWTNHQVEDPGPGPSQNFHGHEQYGMWFVTLTPAGGCGPDPAPAQAVAAGYTCETFRWTCGGGGTGCASGSGDTAGEIDDGTGHAGKKWYYGTTLLNGHTTVGSDFTVDGTGKIVIQTTETCPGNHCGSFVLNTCYAPTGVDMWTGGQFFQHGYFVEFVGEWNTDGSGFNVQTGFYSTSNNWVAPFPQGCAAGGGCWENDNPDAFALGQAPTNWDGGSPINISSGQTFFAPTIETGTDKWGSLVTPSATTYWVDHGSGYVANGTADFASRGFSPAALYNSKQCFGPEATSPFPLKVDSFKVWQAGSAGTGTPQQFTLPNGLGAFAMAQDQNGTIYLEQGDSIWFAVLGWSLTQSSNLNGDPAVLTPGPLDVPTVVGPFTVSPDGTSMSTTNLASTVTSLAGTWTWGAKDTTPGATTDYFLLLNGAKVGEGAFQLSATTLEIDAQGNAFMSQARTGSNKVWLGYTFNATGSPAAGPIPTGVSFNPSYYSNQTSCQFAASTTCHAGFSLTTDAASNIVGHVIATIIPVLSDGSATAVTYQLLQPASNPFKIVGNQLQLARVLVPADEGIVTGAPLFAVANPILNGVTMNNGWQFINVDVLP